MKPVYTIINKIFPFLEFSILLQETQDYNYPIYLKRLFSKKYRYFLKRDFRKGKKNKISIRNVLTVLIALTIFIILSVFVFQSNLLTIYKLFFFILLTIFIPIIVLIANLPTALFRLYYIFLISKARKKIKKNNTKIIAITGSTGKTTTRKMLVKILEDHGSVLSTSSNYNSLWGNAKLLSKYKNEKYVVLEFAMDSPGHVALQSNIIKPDLGAVLNVGYVHMENIGSIEKIYEGKKALADFLLKHQKPVVINTDDQWLNKIVETGKPDIVTYGYDSQDCQLIKSENGKDGLSISFSYKDKIYNGHIPIYGKDFAYNILAAIALAKISGIEIEDSLKSLSLFKSEDGRFEIIDIKEGVKIVNDAYNANPTSMKMSIETFNDVFDKEKYNRIVILGDMKELGEVSREQHKLLGELVRSKGFDKVYYIGDYYKDFNFGERLNTWQEAKEIIDNLENDEKDISILLKASHSIGLFNILL